MRASIDDARKRFLRKKKKSGQRSKPGEKGDESEKMVNEVRDVALGPYGGQCHLQRKRGEALAPRSRLLTARREQSDGAGTLP